MGHITPQSFVTRAPSPGVGREIDGQMCCVLKFVLSPQCGGNAGILICVDKCGSSM